MRYYGGWFDDDDFRIGHHWGTNRSYGRRRYRHRYSLLEAIIDLVCDMLFR